MSLDYADKILVFAALKRRIFLYTKRKRNRFCFQHHSWSAKLLFGATSSASNELCIRPYTLKSIQTLIRSVDYMGTDCPLYTCKI